MVHIPLFSNKRNAFINKIKDKVEKYKLNNLFCAQRVTERELMHVISMFFDFIKITACFVTFMLYNNKQN